MKNKKISYGEKNDLNLKLLITLSRTTQTVHRRSAEIFMKGGLTTSQFAVLEALYHKGSMSINEIIESILSSAGNMTVVINNLEKEQLISRCVNPTDKRSSLISITDTGKEKVEEIFPNHVNDLEIYFKELSTDEKEQIVKILKKLGTA